jgi:cytochrome o ubiquinol oxidase subunit 2
MIAFKERKLLILSTLIMLIVVIPVFVLTAFVSWKYRAGNKEAKYDPEWDNDARLEAVWWGFPLAIVVVLAFFTWKGSHELDPFKPLVSDKKPLRIQVIALQWKWLFIYPEEGIASLNFVQFPKEVPLNFEITADAPMNSFWIPQLGGQIYAMAGMRTKLHLIANEEGVFRGSSANLSGTGFAGMHFQAKAVSQEEFDTWVGQVKDGSQGLGSEEYKALVAPSQNNLPELYTLQDEGLFERIVMQYMYMGKNESH